VNAGRDTPDMASCADYGVVSGYNDDFPQREAWVIGATSRCCPLMACRHGGRSTPVRDFNKNYVPVLNSFLEPLRLVRR
jgi:hypothetical protein